MIVCRSKAASPSGSWAALLRTGQPSIDLGRQTVSHWFDGLAMFTGSASPRPEVSYANRFLRSDAFKGAKEQGRADRRLVFATDPCASLFQRVMAIFSRERPDNCNVSVNALAHQAVALTETPMPVCFDAKTLTKR